MGRDDTPDLQAAAFDAQIARLYLRVTGLPAPTGATRQLIELWRALYAVDADPEAAWAGVVAAVLRDPRVIFY